MSAFCEFACVDHCWVQRRGSGAKRIAVLNGTQENLPGVDLRH